MDRLDEIRARLSAATPGPWYLDDEGSHFTLHNPFDQTDDDEVTADIYCCSHDDAQLLAHSRADLEWAVARIEELEREAECFEEQLEDEIANARMGEDL